MAKLKNAKSLSIRHPYWELYEGSEIIGTIKDKREKKARFPKFNAETGEVYPDRVVILQVAKETTAKSKALGVHKVPAGSLVAVNLKPRIRQVFELPEGAGVQIVCTGKDLSSDAPNKPWQFDVNFSEDGIEDDTPGGTATPEAETPPKPKGGKK